LAPFLCFVATSWSWIDTDICGVFVTAVCARFCLRWWNKFSGEIEIVLRKYLTKHIFFYYISFFLFSSCCSLLFSLFSAFLSFFISPCPSLSHTPPSTSPSPCASPRSFVWPPTPTDSLHLPQLRGLSAHRRPPMPRPATRRAYIVAPPRPPSPASNVSRYCQPPPPRLHHDAPPRSSRLFSPRRAVAVQRRASTTGPLMETLM
jgi:hypothetical protein